MKIPMISNVGANSGANNHRSQKNIIFPSIKGGMVGGAAVAAAAGNRHQKSATAVAAKEESVAAPEPPKMKWGAPTWYILHTMAEKLRDDYFLQFRDDILDVVFTICTNLPCPECSDHAKNYLNNTVFYKNIRSRAELKEMLYNFHNYVNSRKKYQIFSHDELDKKYALANTKNIIENFMYFYQDRSKSVKLLATELYRARIIAQLKTWFQNNIYYFNE